MAARHVVNVTPRTHSDRLYAILGYIIEGFGWLLVVGTAMYAFGVLAVLAIAILFVLAGRRVRR